MIFEIKETRYYESEPNLHYYAFRHYAPTLKRWLSRDPIEEVGGHNLYTFCNNDPIGKFDSLGLSSTVCYPDGKYSCKIVIFIGHGPEIDPKDKDNYLKYTSPADFALLDFNIKFADAIDVGRVRAGVVSCNARGVAKYSGGNAMIINNGRADTTIQHLTPKVAEIIGIDADKIHEANRQGWGPKQTMINALSQELASARNYATSMCQDEYACCKLVNIQLVALIPPKYKDDNGTITDFLENYLKDYKYIKPVICSEVGR